MSLKHESRHCCRNSCSNEFTIFWGGEKKADTSWISSNQRQSRSMQSVRFKAGIRRLKATDSGSKHRQNTATNVLRLVLMDWTESRLHETHLILISDSDSEFRESKSQFICTGTNTKLHFIPLQPHPHRYHFWCNTRGTPALFIK